jgi:hypothetical protein
VVSKRLIDVDRHWNPPGTHILDSLVSRSPRIATTASSAGLNDPDLAGRLARSPTLLHNPLMKNKTRMFIQLGALAIGTAALIVFLFIPIKAFVIVVDNPVPPGAQSHSSTPNESFLAAAVIIAVILAISAWLARKILHRNNQPTACPVKMQPQNQSAMPQRRRRQ